MNAALEPVGLQGALTIVHAQAQRDRLLAAIEGTAGECRLDLSAIEAIDSAGVQLLLAARRSLEDRGGRLALHKVPPVVREVFETYGLQSLLGSAQPDSEMPPERRAAPSRPAVPSGDRVTCSSAEGLA